MEAEETRIGMEMTTERELIGKAMNERFEGFALL